MKKETGSRLNTKSTDNFNYFRSFSKDLMKMNKDNQVSILIEVN